MERIATKQIKNAYSNLKKVEFKDDYSHDSMTGFTLVTVLVTSKSGRKAEFDVDLGPNEDGDDQYAGSVARPKLQEGETKTPVIVTFSDGSKKII
jgi:hypothetical protein